MTGKRISRMAGMPWTAALMRVLFSLVLGVFIVGGMTPTVAAFSGNDSAPAQMGTPAASAPAVQPATYLYGVEPNGTTRVQRSDDGGQTWRQVTAIPQAVSQLQAATGTEPRVYARTTDSVWVSDDAGVTWTHAGALTSRPLSMAVASDTPGLVFVGTESVGLLRSNDGAASWQPVESAVLSGGYAVALAVTALAIDPQDEQIIYASANTWLGTSAARLSPLGVAVSVDGGRQWIQMSRAQLRDIPVLRLVPVAGHPLAVVMVTSTAGDVATLTLSAELLDLLKAGSPAVRASAARAIGLIGNSAALPALVQTLADPDALTGQRAAEAIGRIGDRSVSPALLSMLGTAPAAERTWAALALGLLRTEEAVPGLAALLRSDVPGTGSVAATALAAIGTPAAFAALMAPFADQQLTSARHAAMGALEVAGTPAVAPLAAALADKNPVVRANSAEMLGWLKAAGAVADLTPLLSDSNSAVRAQATWALGEIGTEPAHLALNPLPMAAGQGAALPAAFPGTLARVPPNYWTLVAMAALAVLAASMLVWKPKGPRYRLGHS